MSEIIKIYSLEHPHKSLSYDRTRFYDEEVMRSHDGDPITRYIEVIFVLLFNEHGELIVQKRAKIKNHNPNLLDKSIGGHVPYGDSPNLTAMIETIQELQTPSIVLENRSDFERTLDVLRAYTATTAVMQYIETIDFISSKYIQNKLISLGNRAHIYFGIYAGRVKNVDKEAKGILYYSLDDLEEEIILHEELFTEDLKYLIREYSDQIREFIMIACPGEK